MAFTLTFLALLGLAYCQTKSLQCGDVSQTALLPTVQYTFNRPIQTPPTSIVYGAMMTKYMNVVDCDYVMVENIENNPPPVGIFTEKTTVPVLTVFRVGCIPVTSTASRRAVPFYHVEDVIQARTTHPAESIDQKVYHQKKSDESENANLGVMLDIANRLSTGIDPMNQNITYRDFKFLIEINTAVFALNIVISSLPLQQICQDLQLNATIQLNLEDSFINAKQASGIICFAASYGLYFNESNQEVLSELALLEYAIQAQTYDPESLTRICRDLDYFAASLLGIDTDGIRKYVCNEVGPPAHPPASNTSITVTSPTESNSTGVTGTSPFTVSNTGGASGTVSIVYGTSYSEASSATSAAGTVAPWWNGTEPTASITADSISSGPGASPTPHSATLHYYPPMLRRRAQAGH